MLGVLQIVESNNTNTPYELISVENPTGDCRAVRQQQCRVQGADWSVWSRRGKVVGGKGAAAVERMWHSPRMQIWW